MNNEQFFGDEGLTSASANHIANLAKEYYTSIHTKLENIKLYQETLRILGEDKDNIIQEVSDISSIEQDLKDIAEAKSLIAWIREAIKCKDSMYKEISNLKFIDYLENNNIRKEQPVKKEVTEQDWFDSLSVKDRNKYYTLETFASTFGLYIHGDFKLKREQLSKYIENPVEVNECTNYVLIRTRKFPIHIEDVDNLYFSLQGKYREYQAELNSYKNKKDEWIKDQEIKNLAQYESEMTEYNKHLADIIAQYRKFVIEEKNKIKKLKIVIPNNLQAIYKKINNL